MADCICDLGNIIDEESFNVRVIRELCSISDSMKGSVEIIRMVDQTDDGDVEFLRTSTGDYLLDGTTSYTPVGTVIPYKRNDIPPVPPELRYLLLETGEFILLESGDKIILQH